jgi:soluble lytic murein transglycosylase-like protein
VHKRLLALLVVALASGGVVGLFASVGAGKEIVAAPLAAPRPLPARTDGTPCPIPARFRPAFERAAADTDLPLALLVAVAEVESRFQPRALSGAGARGLLQVMPSTGSALRLDVARPETNVLAGARFLRHMLDHFNSTDLGLAAYNAGPTAVMRAGGAPGPDTVRYVANVTGRWRALVGCS